ncbi:MAG: HAD family hydrolase [Synergistes sp.]|nr:HAD family hydrolase [Synergistes sp.]
MGKIRAAIFDFDMTLVDSSYAIVDCMNELAAKFGLREMTRERLLPFLSYTLVDTWREYWGDAKKEWLDYYTNDVIEHELRDMHLYPNAKRVIETLSSSGVRLAVASNRRNVKKVLDAVGLTDYFDTLVGVNDVASPKPAPDVILKAAEILNVPLDSVVYVGDTDFDITAAKSAPVKGIGMTTGSFTRDKLEKCGAWRVCDDLLEILPLLGVAKQKW